MSERYDGMAAAPASNPPLHLHVDEDEGLAELSEPDSPGGYIVVDTHSLVHLGESV